MRHQYTLSLPRRLAKKAIRPLIRLGLSGHTYLLVVAGRRSGRPYSTPVRLIEHSRDQWWLVAPYGETSWVKNARASGRVELRRGGRSESVAISELGPNESAPILREYVRKVPIVRPFFDAGPDSPLEAFVAEAADHPVFRLTEGDSET